MSMRKKQPFSEQLRQAVRASDISQAELSRRTEIAESIISRFTHTDAGVSMASIDRLCDALDLELVSRNKTTKGGR